VSGERSSAHYCTSCKQKSCGLTDTDTEREREREREKGFEIPRKSGKLHLRHSMQQQNDNESVWQQLLQLRIFRFYLFIIIIF
jgi:hypothetical protein